MAVRARIFHVVKGLEAEWKDLELRRPELAARLKALEGDYGVFPGHGHSSTLEEERRTNPFMQGI